MNGYRGSEWRKWDLHLHTASSYDYGYKGNDSDKKLVEALNKNNISVVAITDHFVIDKKRIEDLRNLASNIVFFPGVELRTDKGDTNIHIILVFDEKADLNILSENFNVFKRTNGKSKDSDEKIYWDYSDILKFAKENNAIISIHAGRKSNGIDNRITNALEHNQAVKKEFADTVDIFEMGQKRDLEEYNEIVFPTIKQTKPMIICSDNHNPTSYNSNLWIKAEPTFEGLKQIIYEPETRVKIQEMKPEEKLGYNVIDSIEFSIPSFCNQKIYFNQNLNTIIGGRSTGKSTLIELLCYKIQGDFKNITELKQEYLKNTIKTGDVIVNWVNKETDKAPEIEYFPQGKMYELAENKDDFNMIIRNILKEDSAGKDLLGFESNQQSASTEIATNIANLFALNKEIENKNISIKENGASQAIKAEIDKIQRNIADISNEEKNTQLLIEEYSDLCKKIELCNKAVEKSRKIKELFESFNNIENILDKAIIEKINAIEDENIKKSFNKFEEKIKEDFDKLSNEIVKNASDVINAKSSELKDLKESDAYKNGEDLKKRNSIFDELNKKLEVEKEKFNKVLELEKERDAKQKQQDELLNQIIQKHFLVIKSGEELCKKLNCTRTDLEIKANFKLKTEVLTDFYTNKFNSRSGDKNLSPYDFLNSYQEKGENIKFCKKFIKEALQKKFVLKGGNTGQGIISELFSQFWYTIDYEVSYQNDKFMEMSPGKQAFVVLKMLLDFSKKKCPILIDQPEDSLDNRAIYKELVSYLKQKKIDRQIILVTHNANIVVGADAEQVIVANKNGNDSPNKDGITFQYCAGALENTKTKTDDANVPVLERQGIREHVCEILEGGKEAFDIREKKYGFV